MSDQSPQSEAKHIAQEQLIMQSHQDGDWPLEPKAIPIEDITQDCPRHSNTGDFHSDLSWESFLWESPNHNYGNTG
jgi:hypothetical protein